VSILATEVAMSATVKTKVAAQWRDRRVATIAGERVK
jgi:hypothetical protein